MRQLSFAVFTFMQGFSEINLLHFRSGGSRQIIQQMNVPVKVVHQLKNQLKMVTMSAEHQDVSNMLCDILNQARSAIRNVHDASQGFEFIAIMLVNGSLVPDFVCQSAAQAFRKHGINLIVVEHPRATFYFRDYYRRLINQLDGAYLFYENVPVAVERAIILALTNGYSVYEGFRRVQAGELPSDVPVNTNQNEDNSDGVGDMEFELGFP